MRREDRMTTGTSLIVEQGEPRSVAECYCDSSLLELAPEVRLRLQRWKPGHWMSSLRFAESYCYPPAERVSYITGANDEIAEACFYREGKWAVVFRCISLSCLVVPRSKILQRLACHRPTDLIRAPFLPASAICLPREDAVELAFRGSERIIPSDFRGVRVSTCVVWGARRASTCRITSGG